MAPWNGPNKRKTELEEKWAGIWPMFPRVGSCRSSRSSAVSASDIRGDTVRDVWFSLPGRHRQTAECYIIQTISTCTLCSVHIITLAILFHFQISLGDNITTSGLNPNDKKTAQLEKKYSIMCLPLGNRTNFVAKFERGVEESHTQGGSVLSCSAVGVANNISHTITLSDLQPSSNITALDIFESTSNVM